MRARGLVALLALAALPLGALAQRGSQQQTPTQELGDSQRRLQEIRAERTQLRRDLDRIRGQVHDVTAEVNNIRRQQAVSAELLKELNFQLGEMQRRIDETTTELLDTQDRLEQKKALLNLRLREIYKRGPLQTEEVLLSARSFSDLLNRYKYLYLVANRDRQLVREVGELHRQLAVREAELRRSYTDLQFLQTERAQENAELASLGASRGQTLASLQRHERSTT
ncbi:MAG TPA: hypothetical protein VFQ39_15735, partial [Longimicrobium sp.]|nr:hypothetical protein [Longimicrobium sp.]